MTEKQIERFKSEYQLQKKMRNGNYSYAILAGELGYAEVATSVSRLLSKNREFKNYDALAKLWNVRKDYLMCIDDFRTNDDIERAGGVSRTNNIETHIKYLELLGYTLKPRLLLHITPDWNPDGTRSCPIDKATWELIKPTLLDGALEMPINDDGTRTLADWDGEELLQAWFTTCIPVRQTIYGSQYDGYQSPDSADTARRIEGVRYTLEYLIYENNELMAQMTMLDLQKLFAEMDSYAKLTTSIQLSRYDGEECETVYAFG